MLRLSTFLEPLPHGRRRTSDTSQVAPFAKPLPTLEQPPPLPATRSEPPLKKGAGADS